VLASVVALAPWSAPAAAAPAAPPPVSDGGGHMQGGAMPSTRMAPMAVPNGSVGSYGVKGIDVASYQPNINWSSVRNAGYSFSLVKATEGTTYTNPLFASQYAGSKAAGLFTGAYAFARPDQNNPVQQAQYFLNTIKFYPDGLTLPPMLDIEEPYGSLQNTFNKCWNLTPTQVVAWVRSYVSTVTGATGQPMIVYVNPNWWNPCTNNSTALAGQLLDVPAWQSNSPTYLPAGFSSWTFWQYTSSASVPGVSGGVDADAFSGDLQQLARLAQPAMAPGTSPSIAALKGGGYVVAYQGVNGTLITLGTPGFLSWGLGMMPGTSPAVAALSNGGWEVAFQANTGELWTVGTWWSGSWGFGMAAGTSPAITGLTSGGYEVAFQSNVGQLWTVGTWWSGSWGFGMAAGTSPAITGLTSGGYEVAFQSNVGQLWTVGTWWSGSWGLGMAAGTSPAITGLTSGGYEVAFQSNVGQLWSAGSWWTGNWRLAMAPATSPAITSLTTGGYEMAYQSSQNGLLVAGSWWTGDWALGMAPGTSPSISGLSTNGYQMTFQANTTVVWTAGSLGVGTAS
jgi:GH25 family lysozyme M1 (1,4-beta-N-acetylmuramidase)